MGALGGTNIWVANPYDGRVTKISAGSKAFDNRADLASEQVLASDVFQQRNHREYFEFAHTRLDPMVHNNCFPAVQYRKEDLR